MRLPPSILPPASTAPLNPAALRELAHADFTDFEPIAPQLAGHDACLFCLGISSSGLSEAESMSSWVRSSR